MKLAAKTDQSENDADELDDIRKGHRIHSAQERVDEDDGGAADDRDEAVDTQNHRQGRTCLTF